MCQLHCLSVRGVWQCFDVIIIIVIIAVLFAGEPVQFPLQFRLSENYPLDVYFLLDVTGSFAADFRTTVVPLATDLSKCCIRLIL